MLGWKKRVDHLWKDKKNTLFIQDFFYLFTTYKQ